MNLMIKPASGHCNLDCKYCFYKEGHTKNSIMTNKTAAEVLAAAKRYAAAGFPIVFQGGEPLLAGYNFFETVVRGIKKGSGNAQIFVQTNATLIDDNFAKLFADCGVLSGVSLDGNEKTHNRYRGDFDGVMRGIGILKRNGCDFNILTVVTDYLVDRTEEIYEFYRKNNFGFQQYIPCIGDDYLSCGKYGEFLCRLFDLWVEDLRNGRYVYIRFFENLMMLLAGMPAGECGANGICSPQFLIESDGSVYPCDFYVDDKYKLGVVSEGLEVLEKRLLESDFISSSVALPEKCAYCKYIDVCRGGCKKYRNSEGEFLFCSAYKIFLDHALDEMKNILAKYGS